MQERIKGWSVEKRLVGLIFVVLALVRIQKAWMRTEPGERKKTPLEPARAVETLTEVKLNPSRETRLRAAFDLLDNQRNGMIGKEDIRLSISSLFGNQLNLDAKDVVEYSHSLWSMLDILNTGVVGFEEFCIAFETYGSLSNGGSDQQEPYAEVSLLFKVLDTKCCGMIDHRDLQLTMARIGYAATEEECRTMIAIMSKDATRKPAAGLTFEVLCEFTDNYEIISNPA